MDEDYKPRRTRMEIVVPEHWMVGFRKFAREKDKSLTTYIKDLLLDGATQQGLSLIHI